MHARWVTERVLLNNNKGLIWKEINKIPCDLKTLGSTNVGRNLKC